MEEKRSIAKKHTLHIDDKIKITGVENIIAIEEKEVILTLSKGTLILTGFGFSPLHLSLEEGVLLLSGEVIGIKYGGGANKEGFFKRLLK